MNKLRVLIADSNRDILEAMRQVIASTGADVSLILATSGQAAINSALSARPHLAMLDIGLPGIDVLTVIRHLRLKVPETTIIVMLTDDNKEYRMAAQRAGACAAVAKASVNRDWMRTVICLLRDCHIGGNDKIGILPTARNGE